MRQQQRSSPQATVISILLLAVCSDSCINRKLLHGKPKMRGALRLALAAAAVAFVAAKAAGDGSAALATTAASLFDEVDANHDGSIDRGEFELLEKTAPPGFLSSSFKALAKKAGFIPALINSITMTVATELGDKTFCIAAVMAMRYNRVAVFMGAISALLVMTVLSVGIGSVLPALLDKKYTHYAAAGLFVYFGVKLLREGSAMSGGGSNEELTEAEEELGLSSHEEKGEGSATEGDSGAAAPRLEGNSPSTGAAEDGSHPSSKSDLAKRMKSATTPAKAMPASKGTASQELSAWAKEWPVLSQAFTITFLAEWGDRSQIATIAMAAAQDPFGVAFGGFVGHSLCTGLAVVGGRLLASKISERAVALSGGALFLLFALHSLIAG